MPEILPLSLRPRTLSSLIGQKSLVEALRKQMTTRPAQAFLFHGTTGTGKTTVARIIARAVQCDHQQVWGDPCEECSNNTTFSIHEKNASGESGKEALKEVAEISLYRPQSGKYRVIILDEAQNLTKDAQNLLLKPFEDPPRTTIWIICTTEPGKILPTLRRRCVTYQLKALSFQGTEILLQRAAKRIALDKPLGPLTEELHLAQIFSPALILMALEKYASGMSPQEAALGGESNVETLRICKAVSNGKWLELKAAMDKTTPEDSRYIRASVSGYLRGMLIRESDPKRRSLIADSLIELSVMAPIDDSSMLFWLWGILHKITRRLAT